MRGFMLKSTSLGRIWGSVDAIQRNWPLGAIPECSIVTALDSTFNSDALARYTGKAPGTFEFHFLFSQHGELISRGDHAKIISTGDHAVPESQKSSSMDRTGVTRSDHGMGRQIRAIRTPFQKTKCQYIEKISMGVMDRGCNRDPQQRKLRSSGKPTKEANGHSGSEPQTCRLYDELHAILGAVPTTTPPLSVDTSKGGVSCNRDEDFGDKEDDDEDSAQQANGKPFSPTARNCSSPWSQYPPNPPKADSWTMKIEKAPLLQMFQCSPYHLHRRG
nr:uncharacterized protein LOC125631253 [Caretta caretta]